MHKGKCLDTPGHDEDYDDYENNDSKVNQKRLLNISFVFFNVSISIV